VPGGASKTQIVYACNLNFHTVKPYLELVTRNGLAIGVEGEVFRYKTTAKGEEALRCMRRLERLMPERGETEEGESEVSEDDALS